MLNRVILIGRLTRDPELQQTPNGVANARMSIAVQRNFANQQGEYEADFIDLRAWRKLAETCATHLKKGRLIAVEGRLEVRSWEKDGQKRKAWEVVVDDVRFLDHAGDKQDQAGAYHGPSGTSSHAPDDASDADVPF